MKRTIIFCLMSCFLLTACHSHEYSNATCDVPKTCMECNKTEGEALGHTWVNATCVMPKTCSTCGAVEGDIGTHTWINATCDAPKTCSVCAVTEGSPLEHSWIAATFETPETCSLCKKTNGNPLTVADFEKLLNAQPMYVESTRYLVQDANYKSLYPDLLSAVIKNNSGTAVKNVVVAFVAWDKNNFPIKIYGEFDYSGSYVQMCNYGDVNMVNGSTFGNNKGMAIDYDETGDIATFKAIVVEYTDFDGNTWTNPYFGTWCNLYENKVLE